jgi:acetolactate synthase-1/2/3 large subunit
VDLIDALENHDIPFVLTGHESAAAFMASAVGRLTGYPGVALATLGPGACNLVLGVGCAYLDRDPMLALSARTATSRENKSNKQNLPLNELFRPITKNSVALDGSNTAAHVQSALELAQTPPQGPVFLSVPTDVATGIERANGRRAQVPPPPPNGHTPFGEIMGALNRARRPIGVVGIALDPERDAPSVRRFLETTALPFVTLPQAKGVADEQSENFLGTVAPGAGESAITAQLEQSDCLLGIGFDPVESSQDWHYHRPFHSIANYSVGFRDFAPALEAVGDVSALLHELGAHYHPNHTWKKSEIQAIQELVRTAIEPTAEHTPRGLAPYHVLRVLRSAAPSNTILTTDVGAHKMLVSQMWQTREPRSFFVSNGLSAMGYGLPTAIAASLYRHDRPVIAVVGDGGFGMMVQELETARRLNVTPLIVVFCDQSLAVIKVAQSLRGIPFRGVDFAPVDWVRVAGGLGAHGVHADTLAGVQDAITTWQRSPALTVLSVRIDETLYAGLTY